MSAPAGWVWEDPFRSESKDKAKSVFNKWYLGSSEQERKLKQHAAKKEEMSLTKAGRRKKSGRAYYMSCTSLTTLLITI